MDSDARYFSTMPAAPFALDETKVIAKLMLEYDDRSEIRAIVHEGNLLKVKSLANEAKQFNYIYNRLNTIPDQLKEIILDGDIVDARFVNLISIMAYDNLFREFVFDVFYDKRESLDPITDYDIMSFFERKASEDATVSNWKYETLFKLRRLYARILFEAGMLRNPTKLREVNIPYISVTTIDLLKKHGFREYVGATVGMI